MAFETVSAIDVPTDSPEPTLLGSPDGYGGRIQAVRVDASSTDFAFAIEKGESPVLEAPVGPDSTDEESFDPVPASAGADTFQGEAPEYEFIPLNPSSQNGASCEVYIDFAIERRTPPSEDEPQAPEGGGGFT